MKLTSAAANNSFCIVRENEIITIKADKMPVGKSHDDNRPFTLHEMDLQKGDVIYTYTDGFSDQFGGPKGKKFKQIQLKELFVKLAPTPMAKQKTQLEQIFNEWRGNLEQVDDVLVIGVRV
jgi:serine phosphatase RsbU (regulator of sigma subunit)